MLALFPFSDSCKVQWSLKIFQWMFLMISVNSSNDSIQYHWWFLSMSVMINLYFRETSMMFPVYIRDEFCLLQWWTCHLSWYSCIIQPWFLSTSLMDHLCHTRGWLLLTSVRISFPIIFIWWFSISFLLDIPNFWVGNIKIKNTQKINATSFILWLIIYFISAPKWLAWSYLWKT